MAEFLTGHALDEKLTDIIWEAKKELIIVSPFIWLDNYSKIILKKLKNRPELEIIIVFGKNEGDTQRSLKPHDLEIFKEFSNIVIIYCKDLHAKYYANEKEALLTSLNLLGKSMTGNVEYGVAFPKSAISGKLYDDSISCTNELILSNPCVFVKRPQYKKILLGLSKKHIDDIILADHTDALYNNSNFKKQLYEGFEQELFESDIKPTREEVPRKRPATRSYGYEKVVIAEMGYCVRTGIPIPFNPQKPFCYEAYQTWAQWGESNFPEKYCHKTGNFSNGRTSMANPIL